MATTHEAVVAFYKAFVDCMEEDYRNSQFLFPDEIREILRETEPLASITVYDTAQFPDVELTERYAVMEDDGIRKYFDRIGRELTEAELADKLYTFMESDSDVYINKDGKTTNILEV